MPLTLPAYGFAGWNALPDMGIAHVLSEGGLVVTSRHGDPYWQGTMTTPALDPDSEHPDFLAFLSRAVDLNYRVDIQHPRYRVPRSYTVANWPLVANCTLAGVTDLRNVTVAGLQVGMTLTRGDRLSLVQGAGSSQVVCHRWLAADVTVSDILAQAIEITPRLPIGVFAVDATVVFKDPLMRVMIMPGSWDATQALAPTAISFGVVEALG